MGVFLKAWSFFESHLLSRFPKKKKIHDELMSVSVPFQSRRTKTRTSVFDSFKRCFFLLLFLFFLNRESAETEGGRGASAEQTSRLQRAKKYESKKFGFLHDFCEHTHLQVVPFTLLYLCLCLCSPAECPPLGMESHKIDADQLTASSMSQYHFAPQRARLNMQVPRCSKVACTSEG